MTMAAGASAAPLLLHTPANPGESDPPTGQSLFDDLFKTEAGYALPFPFEKLVAAIENANADNKVTGVLIPLGRSLQRLSADPDYFTSPRVVIGVDTDSPDSVIALKDRLFIGYQAKSAVIEVVSYNDSVGRFEYQTVNDYDGTGQPVVDYAERSVCLECHQGHAPIFPKALWRETNANPAVAERLGEARIVHGVPVNRGVDAPDALDRATDRANRFALGQFFWGRVCENMQPNCQADLLLAALRYRLGGARRPWTAREDEALGQRLQKAVIDLAPDGVAIITPDLPDRNPLEAVEAGVTPVEAVESEGIFDPTQPRDPIMLVTPDPDAADTLATAVAEIARFISPAMVRDIGEALTSANTATRVTFTAPCRINRYERSNGAREMRFVCRTLQEETSNLRLSGYIIEDNNGFVRGTLAELAPAEYTPVRGLKVAAAFRAGSTLSLTLAEQSYGLPARLASGEALSHLEIDLDDGNGQARISVADDIVLLRKAVNAISASALAPPIRARALTADLLAALSRQGGS
ncbi:MAG: hypothetical protein ACE363_09325 [Alphaproteobacteria bacterium]